MSHKPSLNAHQPRTNAAHHPLHSTISGASSLRSIHRRTLNIRRDWGWKRIFSRSNIPLKRSHDQAELANANDQEAGPPHTRPRISKPVQKCFRLSGVPLTWNKKDVLRLLDDFGAADCQLSLYPAVNSPTQVGLLKLTGTLEDFRTYLTEGERLLTSDGKILVTIDCHFYGLTPLNTFTNEPIAE